MDYQALYQQKLTTAEEAVKVVKSGDWVDYTWCTNHPVALDKALAARKDELHRCEGPGRRHHVDARDRQGRGRRRPLHLALLALQRHRPEDHHQGHGLLQPHALLRAAPVLPGEPGPVDVVMLQVTPMDTHGNFNFGLAASHLADMLARAKCIIVEVNENHALGLRPDRHRDQHPGRGHMWWRGTIPPWPSWAAAASPPTWTGPWPTWWCPRSPTAPACSWASAACPTPSAP